MSEKLTADLVHNGAEYLCLGCAQAIQDRADAQHEALVKMADALEAARAERDEAHERAEAAEQREARLRRLLWMRHGCGVAALYGDDGEMQCGKCLLDFQHDSIERIEQRFAEINKHEMEALAALADVPAAQAAEPQSEAPPEAGNPDYDDTIGEEDEDDTQPAPTTLDPALREPLEPFKRMVVHTVETGQFTGVYDTAVEYIEEGQRYMDNAVAELSQYL